MNEKNLTVKEINYTIDIILTALKGSTFNEAMSILAVVQGNIEADVVFEEHLDKVHKKYIEKVTKVYNAYKEAEHEAANDE